MRELLSRFRPRRELIAAFPRGRRPGEGDNAAAAREVFRQPARNRKRESQRPARRMPHSRKTEPETAPPPESAGGRADRPSGGEFAEERPARAAGPPGAAGGLARKVQ